MGGPWMVFDDSKWENAPFGPYIFKCEVDLWFSENKTQTNR